MEPERVIRKSPFFYWAALLLAAFYGYLPFLVLIPRPTLYSLPLFALWSYGVLRLGHAAVLSLAVWTPFPDCPVCEGPGDWWLLHFTDTEAEEPIPVHICGRCESSACHYYLDLTAVTEERESGQKVRYQLVGRHPLARWVQVPMDQAPSERKSPGISLGLAMILLPGLALLLFAIWPHIAAVFRYCVRILT